MKDTALDTSEVIALMDVYLSEFIHRNNLLWSQTWKFFYAVLIVSLFPNMAQSLGIVLPTLPVIIYRIVSIVMILILLYISISYAKRLEACTATYNMLIKKLPISYQRLRICKLRNGNFFTIRTSYILIYLIYIAMFLLNALLWFVNSEN